MRAQRKKRKHKSPRQIQRDNERARSHRNDPFGFIQVMNVVFNALNPNRAKLQTKRDKLVWENMRIILGKLFIKNKVNLNGGSVKEGNKASRTYPNGRGMPWFRREIPTSEKPRRNKVTRYVHGMTVSWWLGKFYAGDLTLRELIDVMAVYNEKWNQIGLNRPKEESTPWTRAHSDFAGRLMERYGLTREEVMQNYDLYKSEL